MQKKQKYEHLEGKIINYRGLEAEITSVFSYGIEIVCGEYSELLSFKNFDELIKDGSILLENEIYFKEKEHGNSAEKWKVTYNEGTNMFTFQRDGTSQFYNLPVVREVNLDLALYLKRLHASDDEIPITIRNDTYKNMVKEILDKSDPYIWIRKGIWNTTILTIREGNDNIIDNFLEFDNSFSDFIFSNKFKEGDKNWEKVIMEVRNSLFDVWFKFDLLLDKGYGLGYDEGVDKLKKSLKDMQQKYPEIFDFMVFRKVLGLSRI